jgi:hypothetical protein
MPLDQQDFVLPTEAPAKADPFTLQDFIAWAKTVPSETEYEYTCAHRCVWGMYTAARAGQTVYVFPEPYYEIGDARHTLHIEKEASWHRHVAQGGNDSTVGGALSRAEAELTRQRG